MTLSDSACTHSINASASTLYCQLVLCVVYSVTTIRRDSIVAALRYIVYMSYVIHELDQLCYSDHHISSASGSAPTPALKLDVAVQLAMTIVDTILVNATCIRQPNDHKHK
jgi:hypothetical protein